MIEVKNGEVGHVTAISRARDSACGDCIFWYQCRQGMVDCHIKQKVQVPG